MLGSLFRFVHQGIRPIKYTTLETFKVKSFTFIQDDHSIQPLLKHT